MTFTPYLDVKVTSALRVELYDHVAHVRHKVIKQPDNGIWNADPTSNPDSKDRLIFRYKSNTLLLTHPPRLPGSGQAAQQWRVFNARTAGEAHAVP